LEQLAEEEGLAALNDHLTRTGRGGKEQGSGGKKVFPASWFDDFNIVTGKKVLGTEPGCKSNQTEA